MLTASRLAVSIFWPSGLPLTAKPSDRPLTIYSELRPLLLRAAFFEEAASRTSAEIGSTAAGLLLTSGPATPGRWSGSSKVVRIRTVVV